MKGVAENFIAILRGEDRLLLRALVRLGVLLAVVVLLAGLVADVPQGGTLFGWAATLTLTAGVVAGALGFLWGRLFIVRRYRESLVASWQSWMRYSVACSRVNEVHRRVRGRPAARSIGVWAAVWGLALFLSLVLLVVTVLDGPPAWEQAPLFMLWAGLFGFLMGDRIAVGVWTRELLGSIDDLVRRGEVDLWGVL